MAVGLDESQHDHLVSKPSVNPNEAQPVTTTGEPRATRPRGPCHRGRRRRSQRASPDLSQRFLSPRIRLSAASCPAPRQARSSSRRQGTKPTSFAGFEAHGAPRRMLNPRTPVKEPRSPCDRRLMTVSPRLGRKAAGHARRFSTSGSNVAKSRRFGHAARAASRSAPDQSRASGGSAA
jgi:hypothetical protein